MSANKVASFEMLSIKSIYDADMLHVHWKSPKELIPKGHMVFFKFHLGSHGTGL